jgi:hypothetical protein
LTPRLLFTIANIIQGKRNKSAVVHKVAVK